MAPMTDNMRRIAGDFEFRAGGRGRGVGVVSGFFIDIDSHESWYFAEHEFPTAPPFPTGESVVFIAFAADADLKCFDILGWEAPRNVVCFRGELRRATASIEEPEL